MKLTSPAFFASVVLGTFGGGGCLKQILLDGQIAGTRQGAAAFDTFEDWELSYVGSANGIAEVEGMMLLSPENQDAMFMLCKGYTGFAFGFIEDEMERAEDAGRMEEAAYHRKRAIAAYTRAVKHGSRLIGLREKGFKEAQSSPEALAAWLEKNFKDKADAEPLFWLGFAWAAGTEQQKDNAEAVANLWIAVELLKRSAALDPYYNGSTALALLGSYYGRTATAELELSKKTFDEAISLSKGKSLIVLIAFAQKYACARQDAALYTKLLKDVLAAEPDVPELRLMSMVAKRRAVRWLGERRMFDNCSIEPIANTN